MYYKGRVHSLSYLKVLKRAYSQVLIILYLYEEVGR